MGIQDLWDVLRPCFDERVSVERFTGKFVQEHGRSPRLAIDASVFMFNHSNVPEWESATIMMRNFMAKIMKLISLNVTVVVVFDGRFRPNKLRNGPGMDSNPRYEDERSRFEAASAEDYGDFSFPEVPLIKQELFKHRIDYMQAAGEAEAQCAYLQAFGIVDFVVTNDSDAFVFGCTQVLRNFNKVKDDSPSSPKKNTASSKDYYVTPVRISEIESKMGLTWERFVFIASLRGGDYSTGLKRIGIVHAVNLALCDTKFRNSVIRSPSKAAKKLEQEDVPNLSKLFLQAFVVHNSSPGFGKYSLITDPETRRKRLNRFLIQLNAAITKSSRYIFGRLVTINDFKIEEYSTMLYLVPIVDHRLYKFIPQSLGFAELDSTNGDISFSNIHIFDREYKVIHRINSTLDGEMKIIGESRISSEILAGHDSPVFNQHFHPTEKITLTAVEYFIPDEYSSNFKSLILKLAGRGFKDELLIIDKAKFDEDLGDLLRIKYDENRLAYFLDLSESEKEPTGQGTSLVWVSKDLLSFVNESAVNEFLLKEKEKEKEREKEREKKLRKSPKKTKHIQKSNLDLYFQKIPTYDKESIPLQNVEPNVSVSKETTIEKENPFLVTDKNTLNKSQFSLASIVNKKPNLSHPVNKTSSKRRSTAIHTTTSPTKKSTLDQTDEIQTIMSDGLQDLSLVEIDDESTIIEITEAEFHNLHQ